MVSSVGAVMVGSLSGCGSDRCSRSVLYGLYFWYRCCGSVSEAISFALRLWFRMSVNFFSGGKQCSKLFVLFKMSVGGGVVCGNRSARMMSKQHLFLFCGM